MTWDELKEKHDNEWNEYRIGNHRSWQNMNDDKMNILRAFNFMESKVPKSIRQLIDKKEKEWRQEWGVDGRRGKKLQDAQQKEIKIFFERERVKKNLGISLEKKQEKGNGR